MTATDSSAGDFEKSAFFGHRESQLVTSPPPKRGTSCGANVRAPCRAYPQWEAMNAVDVTRTQETRDTPRIENAENGMRDEHAPGPETRRFLEEHFPQPVIDELRRFARAVAGSQAGRLDASEAVIEGILKAARFHRQLEDLRCLKPWLRTIVAREVYARLELAYHRRRRDLDDRALSRIAADESPFEDEHGMESFDERLAPLLRQLPERDRDLLCLGCLQGVADAELARLFDINEAALRKRRSRAMQRLRELAEGANGSTKKHGSAPANRRQGPAGRAS
jgi:RNA polymerase sigma factor (sigma-70 family)